MKFTLARLMAGLIVCSAGLLLTGFGQPAVAQAAGQSDQGLYGISLIRQVPYVPTPQEIVVKMLELAKVTPDDVVYDLGSGDGRIVITAAQKFGAHAVGVEINPDLYRQSSERIVCHDFHVPGWTPDKVVDVLSNNNISHRIYLYVRP